VVLAAGAVDDALDGAGQVGLDDVVGDQLGSEALGLLAQGVHEVRTHDAVGEAGKFSTSVVVISAPPAVTEPSNTSGFSPARAA
jgi:hypothetical protein